MTQERDKDSEFEAYLQGKSGLSDLYADLPPARLPEHLDAAILAEAHRAVHARPGGKPRRSWVIPLSMAASLFVAAIIGAQLRYLAPVDRSAQPPRSAPPGSEPPGPAMRQAAPTTESAKEMVAPERSPAGELKMKKQAIASPAPAPEAATREEAAVPQESRDKAATRANKKAEAYESKQVLGEQAAPAAAAAAPPAAPPPEVQAEAAPMVAGESPPQNTQAAPEGNAPRTSAKSTRNRSYVYVAPPLAPAAPSVAAASAPVGASSMAGGAPLAATADTANLRPEDWLARIRKLKQQGKLDEAKKELAAFRKRYPAYTVPKDLEMR